MKSALTLIIVILISSCSSHPGRVCGGSGGKRCVENLHKKEITKISKSDS